jgi:hypothetical protein
MPIAVHDPIQFFPFDPVRRIVHVKNPPLEGTVVAEIRRHYRVRLPGNAFCLVLKTNPTLDRCAPAAPTSS